MARYHPPISFTACIVPFQVGDATTPRVPLETTENQLSFTLRRVQFLIRLCFAMTINKSQGQSLTQVGVDLRVPAFSHGQLYAALSRVTNVAKQKQTFYYPTLARPSLLSRKIDLNPILLLQTKLRRRGLNPCGRFLFHLISGPWPVQYGPLSPNAHSLKDSSLVRMT